MAVTVIFGGTKEGRETARRLKDAGGDILVCVTSAYAASLLDADLPRRVGALDADGMRAFLKEAKPGRVIDATHPYAVRVTENARACCGALGIPYERVERPVGEGAWREHVERVTDASSAARSLLQTRGNILLTTGSRTLDFYKDVIAEGRVWARVLPTHDALALCESAGLEPSHIIAMQGPFSRPFNAALYDMLDIRAMVTKDSGAQGGVAEKVVPALERDIHVIMIDRPKE